MKREELGRNLGKQHSVAFWRRSPSKGGEGGGVPLICEDNQCGGAVEAEEGVASSRCPGI